MCFSEDTIISSFFLVTVSADERLHYSVTNQIKATQSSALLVVLFIMLYREVLTFESVDERLYYIVIIQIKATKQKIPGIFYHALQGCSFF